MATQNAPQKIRIPKAKNGICPVMVNYMGAYYTLDTPAYDKKFCYYKKTQCDFVTSPIMTNEGISCPIKSGYINTGFSGGICCYKKI